MLFDILGIALAFASVMLFFSMLITAIVQATQSTFNLRYLNLRSGLERLGETIDGIDADKYNNGLVKYLSYGRDKSKYKIVNFIRQFTDIKKTEITVDELTLYIKKNVDNITNEATKDSMIAFKEIEQFMSKRFQRYMHNISILIGFALAIAFQLNTFELIREISIDPKLRDSYIEMAKQTTTEYKDSLPTLSYPEMAKAALDVLGKKHPEYTKQIEEVSGEINSVDDAIDEMKLVIKDNKILDDYELLLTKNIKNHGIKAKESLSKVLSIGAKYNFKICESGFESICGLFSSMNIFFGTLVSGILISLGAPFWYNAINNIASMRDKTKSRQ